MQARGDRDWVHGGARRVRGKGGDGARGGPRGQADEYEGGADAEDVAAVERPVVRDDGAAVREEVGLHCGGFELAGWRA